MQKGDVRSVASVVVLTILTCGIYGFYWIYRTTDDLRIYLNDESISPGLDLVISILCAPYLIYWSYRVGKQIAEAQRLAGVREEDNSILYLVLTLLGLPVVTFAIMQSQLNGVWESNGVQGNY